MFYTEILYKENFPLDGRKKRRAQLSSRPVSLSTAWPSVQLLGDKGHLNLGELCWSGYRIAGLCKDSLFNQLESLNCCHHEMGQPSMLPSKWFLHATCPWSSFVRLKYLLDPTRPCWYFEKWNEQLAITTTLQSRLECSLQLYCFDLGSKRLIIMESITTGLWSLRFPYRFLSH